MVDVEVGAPTQAESLALNTAFDTALGDHVNSIAQTSLAEDEATTEGKLASIYSEIVRNS